MTLKTLGRIFTFLTLFPWGALMAALYWLSR